MNSDQELVLKKVSRWILHHARRGTLWMAVGLLIACGGTLYMMAKSGQMLTSQRRFVFILSMAGIGIYAIGRALLEIHRRRDKRKSLKENFAERSRMEEREDE